MKSGSKLLLTTLNMQMAKKADAWQEYKEAALVDMMLKVYFFFIEQLLIIVEVKLVRTES